MTIFGISISMCRLAQSYRQHDMETILPSKESVNDVEPVVSICFRIGEKIKHTFVCLFTNILYKNAAYLVGGK